MPVLALACLVGLVCPILSGFFADSEGVLSWLIDLAAHWQWLFLAGLVVTGAILTWGNSRWALLFLAAPLPYVSASAQAPQIADEVGVFSVVSANVSMSNRDPGPLVDWIATQEPDVVALFEVSPEYAAQLGVQANFPFQKIVPGRDPFGIAVIARHPMANVDVIHDEDGIAHIELDLEWQQQTLSFAAIHPMPPIEPRYRIVRDAKLRHLAMKAAELQQPSIVVGDLNATPWSSAFSGLEERGLRRVTGLEPTWPAALGGVMGIPIDHVLVSSHWGWTKKENGPDLGSDHFPVIAHLVLKPDIAGR